MGTSLRGESKASAVEAAPCKPGSPGAGPPTCQDGQGQGAGQRLLPHAVPQSGLFTLGGALGGAQEPASVNTGHRRVCTGVPEVSGRQECVSGCRRGRELWCLGCRAVCRTCLGTMEGDSVDTPWPAGPARLGTVCPGGCGQSQGT